MLVLTRLLCSKISEIIGLQNPKILLSHHTYKANIMYSMSKFVSIETSFVPLLEHINYPCLEQLYIVDVVMKILPVFINILEQVKNLKEVSWNQVMPQTSLDVELFTI